MDKEDINEGIILAIEKDGVMPFALTWVQVEIIILSKVSKSEREKQIPYDITCMWNLKYELVYKAETKSQREQICGFQGRGMGEDWTGSLGLVYVNYYI